MQYHFHNVSARDLLVSGEPKWNSWHQVSTIHYLNFFKLFSFWFAYFWFVFDFFLQQLRQPHCPGKPLYTNNASVLLPSKAVKVFWVVFLKFKIYLEIAVASASAHCVGGGGNQVWTVLKNYV